MSSSTITSTWASSARTSFRRIRRTGYNQPTRRAPSRRSCAHSREEAMLIVDSQIHLWQNGKMSAQHRQIPIYSADDALAEMASAGVDCAVIHPPSALGEAVNVLAVEAVRQHRDKFCILGHFDLQSPDRETIVARWRERPGMLGFRFTFNQPHQKAWWTDGSLDWFWAACEKARLPIGLLAGGNMTALAKIAERHPGLKLHIDHLGRLGGGRAGTDDAAFADLPDILALAKFPNVAVKMSGAPSYSSQPYPFRNIHGCVCVRSSRRSGLSARSGAPTSPACRARTGSA